MAIVCVRVTTDEKRAKSCSAATKEGLGRWRIDAGKPIFIYTDEVRHNEFGCGADAWRLVPGKNGALTPAPVGTGEAVCQHFLDMD